jgi:hypothetical protein
MSNYTQLGFIKQTDGENEGSWGDALNENLIDLLDDAIGGYVEVSVASGNVTLAFADGTADNNGRHAVIKFTGSPGTTRTVTFPDKQINYFIVNGSDSSVICTSGTGAATVTIPTGMKDVIYIDGSDEVYSMFGTPHLSSSGNFTVDATTDIILDADGGDIFFKDGGTTFGSATNTSGNLIIKSGTTTALTFSGANVTAAGNLTVDGNLDVTGTLDLSDSNFTNVGSLQLDSIAGDGDTNTSITFSGSDVITVTAGGDAQFTFNNGSIVPSTDNDIDLGTSSLEFKDGYFDGTLYADAINFNGTAIASTAAELNIVDGNTSATSTTVADADRVVLNDNGTMVQVAVTDLAAYFDDEITAMPNLTSVGTLTTLTVDNVIVNGTTIGHTDDTDLITLADGIATVAGEVSMTTLDIGGTNVTTTAAELNLIDGGTARGTTALADGDGILINDNGTMRMTNVTTVKTYMAGTAASKGFATAMAIAL